MIKITTENLERILYELKDLVEIDLPKSMALKITKVSEKLMVEYNNYCELRKNIVTKYSTADEGETTLIPNENVENFKKELSELNSKIITIENVEPIDLKDIPDDIRISPKKIGILLNGIFNE